MTLAGTELEQISLIGAFLGFHVPFAIRMKFTFLRNI